MAVPGPELWQEKHTLPGIFLDTVKRRRANTALRQKNAGVWREISWQEYGEHVRLISSGLLALGLEAGDRVCVIGDNSPEWLFADIGTLSAGGVTVGIYTTDSASQVEYILNDCGARCIFVENDAQLDKILSVWSRTPSLDKVVTFDVPRSGGSDDPRVISLKDLRNLGSRFANDHTGRLQEALHSLDADSMATLVYTSGTTGEPKGAMLSHRNILYQAAVQDQLLPIGPEDQQISFLPYSHIGERLLGGYRHLVSGSTVSYPESQLTLFDDIREIAPSIFFGVPRIWEKFHSIVIARIGDAGRIRHYAIVRALGLGLRIADRRLADQRISWLTRAAYAIAKATVLKGVRRWIGMQRLNFAISGGAPIEANLLKWFIALGIDMRETYGLTESSGVVSIPPAGRHRIGTVGRAMPGSSIRIADDDEILVRGPQVFLGYFGKKDKTAEAITEGWLHTGDLGRLDEEGFLSIIGRKKDIIITAGGKNVSPAPIENQLRFSPYIADAMVIGDARKYLTCLIMVNQEAVAAYAESQGHSGKDLAGLCELPAIRRLMQSEIDKANSAFSRPEQIKRFHLLDVVLQPGDEELTSTMKLKRNVMQAKYARIIDAMYDK